MLPRLRFPIALHMLAIVALLSGCASKGPQLTGAQPQISVTRELMRPPRLQGLVFVPAYAPLKSRTPEAKKAAFKDADQTALTIAQLTGNLDAVAFRLQGQQLSLGIKQYAITSAMVSNRKALDDHVVSLAIASRPKLVIQQMERLDVVEVRAKLPAPTPALLDVAVSESLREAISVFASKSPSRTPSQALRGVLTVVDYRFIGGWAPSEFVMYVNVKLRTPVRTRTRKRKDLPKNMPPEMRRALEQRP